MTMPEIIRSVYLIVVHTDACKRYDNCYIYETSNKCHIQVIIRHRYPHKLTLNLGQEDVFLR